MMKLLAGREFEFAGVLREVMPVVLVEEVLFSKPSSRPWLLPLLVWDS